MKLLRQGSQFLVIGLVQLCLDWSLFVAFTTLGVPVPAANVASRVCAALVGFWLNGRFTFAHEGRARLGWRPLSRYVAVWLVLTAASTLLVGALAAHLGLEQAWLAKPVVEAGLAVLSFLLMRHVVYR
ncbi:MAG TPA: GtrA family protein [Stenotrophomonas sp.]|nr:GtrA family protein [Stenotrophomonas sp.]